MIFDTLLVIYSILLGTIGIRSVICYIELGKMIEFYYSDETGWDTYQKSIYEVYPSTDILKMTFKFWVWPVSRFYPEHYQYKKYGNPS